MSASASPPVRKPKCSDFCAAFPNTSTFEESWNLSTIYLKKAPNRWNCVIQNGLAEMNDGIIPRHITLRSRHGRYSTVCRRYGSLHVELRVSHPLDSVTQFTPPLLRLLKVLYGLYTCGGDQVINRGYGTKYVQYLLAFSDLLIMNVRSHEYCTNNILIYLV